MKAVRLGLAAALGLGFGIATSMANDLGLGEGSLGTAARVVSIVLDAGWAWAALAVVAGALAVATAAAAVAGTLSLVTAVVAYFATDTILRDEPFSLYGPELARWLAISLVAGPVLGVVGAVARRPGTVGLGALLVVPAGALMQMLLFPPGAGALSVTYEQVIARFIVATTAVAGSAAIAVRFVVARPPRV